MIGMFVRDTDKNEDGGRGELINMISSMIAGETDINAGMVLSYLEKMSLEELIDLIRPTVEEQAKSALTGIVEASLVSAGLVTSSSRAEALTSSVGGYSEEQCALYYDKITVFSDNTLEETLVTIGCVELDTPKTVNLYASSFEKRDAILSAIDTYNKSVPKERQISNTDYLGIMMSSITIIINAITYVLIAFVAISLVVSSIMIGVITLISVQERTKEIGILRAIGASKKDIRRVFNAETLIIGFVSGMIGILATLFLNIIINIILFQLTEIAALKAVLPVAGAIILVLVSMFLTFIAGLFPSGVAAKRNPVEALRSE
jgi:putative ABC transport system permease protein